ncbi:transcription repressor OFP6-like [Juglans microcarpa x Juglans regia]|uniref:transcription repressor OFP6-like n=1 Tax=Juglans microcarpa x Juglans regia TaxID=2249226 RepID=UPI001B7E3F9C|nr:transcription repressor OFP6-like [Juglans microcarpa x Juglans regia]
MPTTGRKLLLNTVSVNIGCSCRKPKLFHIFHPKPRPKTPTHQRHNKHHSSGTWHKDNSTAAGTFSPSVAYSQYSDAENETKGSRSVRGFGRIDRESVAVEKDSNDPYLDFRQSMLQMILENEIYSKDDLRELLHCFLQLNSPYHHGLIVKAFSEIWNGVFSVRSSSPKLQYFGYKSREF